MNYKILCSDLDGTLLSTKNDVSDFTVSEISRIKQAVKIILVSARMPRSITYLQRRLGIEKEPIICYNGALILEGETEVFSSVIAIEHVTEVHGLAKEHNIKLGLYYKNEWYVEENSERVRKEVHHTKSTPVFRNTTDTINDWKQRNIGPHKIMLMGTKNATDTIFRALHKNLGERLHLYRSNDTLIEIAPKSISKLSAIKLLLNDDRSLVNIIAFGDNYNDIEMLQNVGCGVAVGNAREEVKTIADKITLNNTEDGVAHYIKQHLLI